MNINKDKMKEIIKRTLFNHGSFNEENDTFEINDCYNESIDHIADDIIFEMKNLFGNKFVKNVQVLFDDEYEIVNSDVDDMEEIKIKLAYYSIDYRPYPGDILYVKFIDDNERTDKYCCTAIDKDYIYLKLEAM